MEARTSVQPARSEKTLEQTTRLGIFGWLIKFGRWTMVAERKTSTCNHLSCIHTYGIIATKKTCNHLSCIHTYGIIATKKTLHFQIIYLMDSWYSVA